MKPLETHFSPFRTLVIVAGCVFFVEFVIMIGIRTLIPNLGLVQEVFLDSCLLVLFLLPALVIFVVTPLERQIQLRAQAEDEISNARAELENRVRERTAELERLNRQAVLHGQMGEMLQTCNTKEEACRVVENIAQKLFPQVSGSLFIYSASRNDLDRLASWGEAGDTYPVMTPDACWALRRGRVFRETASLHESLCHSCRRSAPLDSLCIPMMAQGETTGILQLSTNPTTIRGENHIGVIDENTAVGMAEQVAMTFANLNLREALKQQSIRDPLTGLFNRRYMEETLAREIARCKRDNTPLSVIMMDLDHFKRFNDTFGHEAGDLVLKAFGQFIVHHVRGADIACRYGGEEFICVLPGTSLETATQRAEELCAGVRALHLSHQGQPLGPLTLSLGLAAYPEHGESGAPLIQTADGALYRAKQNGRDRVEISNRS